MSAKSYQLFFVCSFERQITGWYPSKVTVSLEEMVKVQAMYADGQSRECWVELESAKIARVGTYTKSEKMDNFIYFKELYKLIEPGPSSSSDSYQRRY